LACFDRPGVVFIHLAEPFGTFQLNPSGPQIPSGLACAPGFSTKEHTMIRIDGATLRVKKIKQSRNGAFCVADLSTEIGEFKVKDPMLDQFDEGQYQATVWITEIFLAQYISYGKAVTEMRARLNNLEVQTADALDPSQSEPAEHDPMDEPASVRAKPADAAPPAPAPAESRISALKNKLAGIGGRKTKPADTDATPSTQDGHTLFGDELWALIQARRPVKLDPTVDRGLLRRQSAMMHQLNFKFAPTEQTWNPL
jgi:hypothetical protein